VAISLDDLQKRINNLKLIHDLASDPEYFLLMRELTAIPASKETPEAITEQPPKPASQEEHINMDANGKGGLYSSVRIALNAIFTTHVPNFTISDIVRKMEGLGHVFGKTEPAVAVNPVMKKLLAEGVIEIESEGRGRIPTVYRRAAHKPL